MIAPMLLLLLSASVPVDPQIEAGVQLRRERRDAEALEQFKQAYRRSGSSRALAQIALAEQALGRWIRAEKHLLRALNDKKDPWIERNRKALDSGLRTIQQRLVSLELDASVEGARVLVNGKTAGTIPVSRSIRAVAGTVVVEVRAEGYWPMTRHLTLSGGTVAREFFTLVQRPSRSVDVTNESPPSTKDPRGDVLTREGPSPNLAPYGYSAMGLAAAAGGTGIALLLVRNGHANDYNDCIDNASSGSAGCRSFRDSANSTEVGMIASFAAAGAFAVTSAILFVLDGEDRSPRSAQLGIDPGGRVFCSIPF